MTPRLKLYFLFSILMELKRPCTLNKRTILINLALEVVTSLLVSEPNTVEDRELDYIPF